MKIDKKKQSLILAGLDSILKKFGKTPTITNLDLTTSTGDIITFAELAEDAVPKVGDMATINGEPAQGEVIVVDSEDTKTVYVFDMEKKGELLEIKDTEEDEDETETVENLKAKVAELETQLQTATAQNKSDIEALSGQLLETRRYIVSMGDEGSDPAQRPDPKKPKPQLTDKEKDEEDLSGVINKLAELKKKKNQPV